MLLDCGSDSCTGAVWSPRSREIVYSRENKASGSNGIKNAPCVWLLDTDSGETTALFKDEQKSGTTPAWSPDGQWLSIWNSREGMLEIVNRRDLTISVLESENSDAGCWSSDSSKLYFTNTTIMESTFRNVIQAADLLQGSIETILGSNLDNSGLSYDQPACHPGQDQIAVSIQPNVGIAGKELAVIDLNTGERTTIMNDLSRIPGYYSWNPSGDYFLFQMAGIGQSPEDSEIWLWEKGAEHTHLMIEGGRLPAWLP
jgi:Tol biopolymer transport system component